MLGLLLCVVACIFWSLLVWAPRYPLSALVLLILFPLLVVLAWMLSVGRLANWLNRASEGLSLELLDAEDRLYK